jgi:hypothetical protein
VVDLALPTSHKKGEGKNKKKKRQREKRERRWQRK